MAAALRGKRAARSVTVRRRKHAFRIRSSFGFQAMSEIASTYRRTSLSARRTTQLRPTLSRRRVADACPAFAGMRYLNWSNPTRQACPSRKSRRPSLRYYPGRRVPSARNSKKSAARLAGISHGATSSGMGSDVQASMWTFGNSATPTSSNTLKTGRCAVRDAVTAPWTLESTRRRSPSDSLAVVA
jgi:hypothetical protein